MSRDRLTTLITVARASVRAPGDADVVAIPEEREYRPEIEKVCPYCGLKHVYFFCPRGCDSEPEGAA